MAPLDEQYENNPKDENRHVFIYFCNNLPVYFTNKFMNILMIHMNEEKKLLEIVFMICVSLTGVMARKCVNCPHDSSEPLTSARTPLNMWTPPTPASQQVSHLLAAARHQANAFALRLN